ncbi:hypothetical protein, partial [Ochrobactrum sp. SFR4]|uniref:hypothetical protein n=1 Tax=Ochrobactrum sp. SFR4 TaxID=2717368 RepID=UPI001C8C3FFC
MRETTRQCQGVARQIVDALEQLRRDGHQTKRFEDQFNRLVPHFHEQRSQPEYLAQLVELLNDVLALYAHLRPIRNVHILIIKKQICPPHRT